MAEPPAFAPGHEHAEDCRALHREWRRYHAVVEAPAGVFTANQLIEARYTRDMFDRQLRALGCSADAFSDESANALE